jgi:glycosyltransferase involved in cell wall biosynthesis
LLKILQLAHRLPWPPIDGGKKGSLGFVNGYRHHPSVASHRLLCMCPQEEGTWASEWGAQGVSVQVELMDARNTVPRLLANTLFSKRPFNMEKYRRTGFFRQLEAALRMETPDVVHFDSLHTACYASLVQRLAPRALRVLRCHNAEYVILKRLAEAETNLLKRRVIALQARRLKMYEAASLDGFDLILAITEADAARFRTLNPRVASRMIIVPAGADLPTALPPASPMSTGTVRLIHIAAMDWLPNQSGLRWFIDQVLPLLEAAGMDYHLDVVGKSTPPEFFSLRNAHVTVHGFLPDLSAITASAHLAVVPLQVGGGMRVKILDYWALGIPVVSTTVGAEGLSDATYPVVELADDPPAFAASIRRLGTDASARERLRTAAFAKVSQEYGWPGLVDGLVDRYQRQCALPAYHRGSV